MGTALQKGMEEDEIQNSVSSCKEGVLSKATGKLKWGKEQWTLGRYENQRLYLLQKSPNVHFLRLWVPLLLSSPTPVPSPTGKESILVWYDPLGYVLDLGMLLPFIYMETFLSVPRQCLLAPGTHLRLWAETLQWESWQERKRNEAWHDGLWIHLQNSIVSAL